MEATRTKGYSFGQRSPPLTDLIKSILVRYPDGGQILKELIQNADDAGASEVKFFYDNQSFGSNSLFSPELHIFQGPALYCYNNATFKKEDWEGIQNLMRSNKKEDPSKVGQFGIGFNSVYHITDLPGIVSGGTVGFLDPHERYFARGESGKGFYIKQGLLHGNLRDQFLPFHDVFGCDLTNTAAYTSTLFRFPLRKKPSQLSDKEYTPDMIDNLFDSLREEASVILLFLKSVQSISIYERKDSDEVECVFKVEVSQDCQEEVKHKRQGILKKASDPSFVSESKYIINIKVKTVSRDDVFRWLVVNRLGCADKRVLELSATLHLLPWVGMAVPINHEVNHEGRIFCFLPLPPDVECQTGLPVHVHGYFGLTDNRRGLTWPGPECQHNETAEWNKLLLTKIGCKVYYTMLKALINDPFPDLSPEELTNLVYNLLPVLEKVRGHWNCILEPLFQKLRDKKIFYAEHISGNSWIQLTEGILDCLQESGIDAGIQQAVMKVLLENVLCLKTITNIPQHVLTIVRKYFPRPKTITPLLVRGILRECNVNKLSRQEKLYLLNYVLSDGKMSDLNKVPLLPLADGCFTTFRSNKHSAKPSLSVFVPYRNCTKELLPSMVHRFLDDCIPSDIKIKLCSAATTQTKTIQSTQLVRLTDKIVLENMHKSLPSEWLNCASDKVPWKPGESNHPPESWLKAVWAWLNTSFPETLTHFQGIPLIPLSNSLGILSKNSTFIFSTDHSNALPEKVSTFLTLCGCTVLSSLPNFVHHKELNLYVASPTPADVLNMLSRLSISIVQDKFVQVLFRADDRTTFRNFMARLPDKISISQQNVLVCLPLFDTVQGGSTAIQPKPGVSLKSASSEFVLPSNFQLSRGNMIISCTDTSTIKLLKILNVKILKPADVLIEYLFPDLYSVSLYSNQQVTLIMPWILKRFIIFHEQSTRFLEQLKSIPFVITKSKKRKRPSELYDPHDTLLCKLLTGETDVFPIDVFATDDAIFKLRYLGLKTRKVLTDHDILKFAQRISSSQVSAESIGKAQALIKILEAGSDYQCLNHSTSRNNFSQLKWLPCEQTAPRNYPEFMPWYTNAGFFSQNEIYSPSKVLLVGSSLPTLGITMGLELQTKLGIADNNPPILSVVSHLQHAVRSWKGHEEILTSSMVKAKFQEMLTTIYLFLSKHPPQIVNFFFQKTSLEEWVWHGEGFCSPKNAAFCKEFYLDLRPRLFLLQNEFKNNKILEKFFLEHGVREHFSIEDILGILCKLKDKYTVFERNESCDVNQDLQLCCAILTWVVRNGKVLSSSLQKKVFVPVQSRSDVLLLEACKECTYCDRDWLRQGGSEIGISEDYKIVHDSIPDKVARLLGVPPLSTCLLSAETLGFEQTGPYESITNRLKTILQEYKEGVGIFKELIQNADDAGATEVSFMVDWRWGPKEKLLSPNMADCQGPALWAYNNGKFSDEDFENINKLAGATKVESLDKIGRFGLGFNSVYHLTDVPSFVSREYFVIFDPNVNHLQSHIKDKSRPGLRINLATNPKPLVAFKHQFQPYHGVFNCNTEVHDTGEFYCDGTLFRFPFRTLNEANKSEICKNVYDKEKVHQIVSSFRESLPLLLLYTQHVEQVKLFVTEDGSEPINMHLVLSVSKETPKILTPNRSSFTIYTPFIKECSHWWRNERVGERFSDPSRCEVVSITTKEMPSNLINNAQICENEQSWLISSGVGSNSSLALSSGEGRHRGLLPCAGAACKLSKVTADQASQPSLKIESVEGEAFCFLPLSIPTGFPVHVNGYFALTSNRRAIWERTTSRQCQQIEVRWNECLIEDALLNAYVQLLNIAKSLIKITYCFYKLWPVYDGLSHSSTWGQLAKSFYKMLVEQSLPLLYSEGKWLTLEDGYILDEKLCDIPKVIETTKFLDQVVFVIPPEVKSSFIKSGQSDALERYTLNLKTFLAKHFFPNIKDIPQRLRDPIVCYVLDLVLSTNFKTFSNFFNDYPCITCSNNGRQLAKPSELISPAGSVAILFSSQDNRFPVGEFLNENRIFALERLGMIKNKLSWHEICGRADSVRKVATGSYEDGRKRAKNLIKYLTDNVEKLPKIEKDKLAELLTTKFLPVLSTPPDGYHLPWKGSEANKEQYFAPVEVFMPSDRLLVGSSCLVLDDSQDTGCGKLSHSVKYLLGFLNRSPNLKQILQQLDAAIQFSHNESLDSKTKKNTLEEVCHKVYKNFNDVVTRSSQRNEIDQATRLLEELKQRPWILIKGQFVFSDRVASNWGGNGYPYLYCLPYEYVGKYDKLLIESGVRQSFDEKDFLKALNELKDFKNDSPLTDQELKLAICFLTELKDQSELKMHIGQIPLPDTERLFCKSKELTINLTAWLKDRGNTRYVHQDIPQHLALGLGAKSLQSRRLKKYSNAIGSSFGQHEKLTDRLKNILKSYPCDCGILKELVQNADDAGATEIHFVYDKRKLPCKRVVQEHAEEIQGPALCVYNNRPFSDKDLEGIQNIGIGSKNDDSEKTGQYGIGFNSVYHLTDCPSFLSNDDTLCFLDPHCRYAPEATSESPGEQFKPIDEEFKEDYKDVLLGYLGNHFELKGATMFRLPLRTPRQSLKSFISNKTPDTTLMQHLLVSFKMEARKVLLFLNHVKKLSLSEIDENGELLLKYRVEATLDEKSEQQRWNLSHFMKTYKDQETYKVPWNGTTYPLTVTDSQNVEEVWLVHQCCGTKRDNQLGINGRPYGLFPRGGIAALVSQHLTPHIERSYVAYCFLPLPVKTPLPVHVNGHFALDSSRRNLWYDTNPDNPFTKWNHFMISDVLAPGYTALICEAIKYIPYSKTYLKTATSHYFENHTDANIGLNWFHKLFPHPSKDSMWSILACEVYRLLEAERDPVFPVVVPGEDQFIRKESPEAQDIIPQIIRNWLPVQEAYFVASEERFNKKLWGVLLRIHFPLLIFSPATIQKSFEEAGVKSKLLHPRSVIEFLREMVKSRDSIRAIGQLPSPLVNTNISRTSSLVALVNYCKKDEDFPILLEGLPMLLTADNQLRIFNSNHVVYRSSFSDLFPDQAHLFVHPDIIHILPEIRDIATPPVMKHFTINSLPQCFRDVFPSNMQGNADHIPWTFLDTGPLSKKWFQRLWVFLEHYTNPEEDEEQVPLDILGEWPIVPTTNENLVAVNCSKTVLDAMPRKTEMPQAKHVREILMKLDCPTLNTEITLSRKLPVTGGILSRVSFWNWTETTSEHIYIDDGTVHATDPYVAHPHSGMDTLQVLERMRKFSLLNASNINDEDIQKLLAFFQSDLENLKSNGRFIQILQSLPFYKAINGNHFSLSLYTNSAIVPSGVPTEEVETLQQYTGCLFLQPCYDLKDLFQALGVGVENNLSEFYTKYIIPSFNIFSRESQIQYLIHIRDSVLAISLAGKRYKKEKEHFVTVLTESLCIPDENGNLHRAEEFYDPRNKVFNIMYDRDSNTFPPTSFEDDEWLEFLSLIGLQTDVEENQFLDFCSEVAQVANTSREDERNAQKSQLLVEYLREKEDLWSERFLVQLSRIKFVVPEKIDSNLISLHEQYRCNIENGEQPYVQLFDAVPWEKRILSWTSADLLPSWVELSKQLIQYLGIQEIPSVDTVVNHLRNISCTLAEISRRDEVLPQADLLRRTMISIYKFLELERNCKSKEISNLCSDECKIIGRHLKSIPCILVGSGKMLVKGDQLTFSLENQQKYIPFLYTVPREYGPYEHLLKRLGTTEELTSLQLAGVLKSIKNQCQDNKMNPNFASKACWAMGDVLRCAYKESDCGKKSSLLSSLTELFLPSENGFLVKSTDLVCQIPSRLQQNVLKLNIRALLPLVKCFIEREKENDYLNALPSTLRPKPFSSIFKEVLDPSCLDDICPLIQVNPPCQFIEKYKSLFQSSEFQQGIERLLKHQKNSNELSEKEKERSSVFNPGTLVVKCMHTLRVHLVDAKTEEPLENSSCTRSCYVVDEDRSWTIFIQHDSGKHHYSALVMCVNKILDWTISDPTCMLAVADMLGCDSPSQIPGLLNQLDIARDFDEEATKPGREVPVVFHHLLQQNPMFVFHEREIVAYSIETNTLTYEDQAELEDTISIKYIIAIVISRIHRPGESTGSYDFTAEYEIDLGQVKKIVSVLDLYKFYQNEFLENPNRDLLLAEDSPRTLGNLTEEKRKLFEAIRRAWNLPEVLRRKAIRRLYLRWHPDKNPDNVEFATEMMQFLLEEIRRREADDVTVTSHTHDRYGFNGLFTNWNRRARQDRETFQNFRNTCHNGTPFTSAAEFTVPDPPEARRWVQQANRDLEAAEYLLLSPQSFYALVCFLSQQIVEKCLKAALYARCGLGNEQLHTHDVYKLSNDVCRLWGAPGEIQNLTITVANYYLPTRYPNRQPSSIIPADAFTREQSQVAVRNAKELVRMVENFMRR